MSEFTLLELKEIMTTSAGVDEGVELDGDIAGVEFADLGYDSLAMLELRSQVERRYGVSLPDDAVSETTTPGDAVAFVNDLLSKAAV
ncbi:MULTISPECIES: acyl carrier protein [unclassified Amycolatopsis]|jgi:act minimal PKS acyl carrier protein|uniref:acyl carrier protein n=1 Tax=unclassified Amycolatopsis TaxID=2618356 RepID=UPI001FF2C16B|nr:MULTISPECIES: acyl carrier protein [unclassified Amycolatopsis]UOZ08282.1 acyl carrier protein [Amycolatopsis sp. WQ 127309]WSJ74561.1 acyl carrier protein [Amycolatopsis sp. NBC_01307]WSK81803.1 acyl carrier protein [Amycolatopsis sp. NBC_01286]